MPQGPFLDGALRLYRVLLGEMSCQEATNTEALNVHVNRAVEQPPSVLEGEEVGITIAAQAA